MEYQGNIAEAENNVGIDEIVQQIESFKSYEEQINY